MSFMMMQFPTVQFPTSAISDVFIFDQSKVVDIYENSLGDLKTLYYLATNIATVLKA